ncbi:MAG: DNA repair protein RecN [Xenococcaceae cyanobacterium MO_188.B32]|nr:DNA repair protein RecN [Xenococcaceae cyanobacterium MO_188.B32]
MLVALRINNFALVDRLELDFDRGLNVLTGETGAGKSIILDAIDVTLGGKVNTRMIRGGSERAIIEATFQLNSTLLELLAEQEIEPLDEDTLVCSRELAIGKEKLRSRCRVNGVTVNRQVISELRSRLVEITAQGQTVNLLISERQRELLDSYGGKSLLKQREKVAAAYLICQQAKQALAKRRQSEQELLQRQDLLEYQLKDLREAELGEADELEQLEQERDRLSHVVELQQLSYQTYQILYQNDTEETAAADLLAQAEANLTEMVEYDSEIESILSIVQSALNQVIEAGQQISSYGEGLEADPERLEEVEARIRLLKNVCRKYGSTLAEAIAYYEQIQQELEQLTNSDRSIAILEQEYQIAQTKLERACTKLTQLRQKAANKLATQLVKELKPLAMDKVIFECRLLPCAATATGADKVVFYFSPNAGEEIQPLAVIASGGEMSRFLLALKACFSQSEQQSSTLIFDEIDAGVSGKVAQAIAEKLHQLSQKHQVLCVTHQPLVAAMADGHFRVEKQIVEETSPAAKDRNGDSALPDIRTVVRVKALTERLLRREELAQLTGGHSAEDAIAFADSLLTKADRYRLSQS